MKIHFLAAIFIVAVPVVSSNVIKLKDPDQYLGLLKDVMPYQDNDKVFAFLKRDMLLSKDQNHTSPIKNFTEAGYVREQMPKLADSYVKLGELSIFIDQPDFSQENLTIEEQALLVTTISQMVENASAVLPKISVQIRKIQKDIAKVPNLTKKVKQILLKGSLKNLKKVPPLLKKVGFIFTNCTSRSKKTEALLLKLQDGAFTALEVARTMAIEDKIEKLSTVLKNTDEVTILKRNLIEFTLEPKLEEIKESQLEAYEKISDLLEKMKKSSPEKYVMYGNTSDWDSAVPENLTASLITKWYVKNSVKKFMELLNKDLKEIEAKIVTCLKKKGLCAVNSLPLKQKMDLMNHVVPTLDDPLIPDGLEKYLMEAMNATEEVQKTYRKMEKI